MGPFTRRPKCCCPVARLILKTDEPSMPNRSTSEWPRCSRYVALTVLILTTCVSASDWPAYRRDARRSAVSEDQLAFPLRVAWQRQSKLPPRPAFEDPFKHPTDVDFACIRDHSQPVLLDFDHAFHPVAAGGRVFFGSSADDSVRCLSLDTGQELWSFVTGGPVRFAPHVDGNRLYVGSDDGFVYCLNIIDGEVVWTFRAAPSERQLVGNQRMISRWPLRSGVLVLDGVVYVTAGMWPAEGVFIYALNAATGNVLWVNDTSGTLNQPTANRSAYAITGVAPTGYLLAAKKALVVPTGRSMPASYSQKDGRLLASTAPSYQNRRGGPAVCIDKHGSVIFGTPRERITAGDYSVLYIYQLPDLTQFGATRGDRILAADRTFMAVNDVIKCVDINSRYTRATVEWQQPCPSRQLRCLSLSANALLMGIDDRIVARDRATGELLWEYSGLDGYVHSIAIADERLLVATDSGSVYCFAAGSVAGGSLRSTPATQPALQTHPDLQTTLKKSGIRRGLALVVGESDTRLAVELAATTQLQVVLLLDDSAAVTRARRELLDTHIPGRGQISVQQDVEGKPLPFSDFAFNLIVTKGDVAAERAAELYRVLRPAGGVLYVDNPVTGVRSQLASLIKRELWKLNLRPASESLVYRRGKLPGALDWDSESLTDQRVKWPLELLWFGGPGAKRTGGGSRPPIAAGGRDFVIGRNHLIALDAYNGTELWSRTLPYLYRTIGRLQNVPGPINPWLTESVNADDDHVWLNFGHVVHTLDANTGEQLAVHGELPAAPIIPIPANGLRISLDTYQKPGPRNVTSKPTQVTTPAGNIHVAVEDNDQLTMTLTLHADVKIEDRVYWELFLDVRRPGERANLYTPGIFQLLVWPARGVVETGIGPSHPKYSTKSEEEGRRVVVSIPVAELEKLHGGDVAEFCFAAALNHPASPDQKAMAGNRVYLRWEYHADAFAAAFNNGWPTITVGKSTIRSSLNNREILKLPPITELPERALKSGRIGVVGQRAGSVVKLKGKRQTPLSLEPSEFEFNRGKGCGRLVSSDLLQVLRSGTLAFYDVNDDSGMRYFGGVRPACTISAIPAQGLVFAAEGSSYCSCNYNFKTTLALAPTTRRRNEDWAMFTAPLSPGAQLQTGRFNLGAPGDRRDGDGSLWLQYPRAPTYSSRVLPSVARTMPVPVQLLGSNLRPYRVNADRVAIGNTDRPWLYTSGHEGIEGVRVQLFMSDKEGIVVFPGAAPKLDAVLESESWERRYSAPAGTGSSIFLSHDSTALYVGYEVVPPLDRRGKRLPWTTREGREVPHATTFKATDRADDTAVWEEDSLEFLVSDTSLQTILHFGVGISGGRYDGVWSAKTKKQDAAAPAWSGAINVSPDKAIAEFALPWQTLRDAGLDVQDLVIRPRTRKPLTRQPHISHGFRPIIVRQEKPATMKYRVTLHFAELKDVVPGDRVFDIEIQGQTVVKSFDPIASAPGRNRAISRSFNNIPADRVLDVRLISPDGDNSQRLPPILSALEVVIDR